LLREALAFALGAAGLLLAEHNGLKLVFAFPANVFKDRHKNQLG
jgi:hypothetical protein